MPADDGKLFAFGLNQDGQLGLGHTETTFDQVTAWSEGTAVQLAAGVAHTVALTGIPPICLFWFSFSNHQQVGPNNW